MNFQRKWHKGKKKFNHVITNLTFGDIGLRAVEPARLTTEQLESAVRTIRRFAPRGVLVYSRIKMDRSVTGTPIGSRIGKGKGAIQFWAGYVKAGQIIIEIKGISNVDGLMCLKKAKSKLPCCCVFAFRRQRLQ